MLGMFIRGLSSATQRKGETCHYRDHGRATAAANHFIRVPSHVMYADHFLAAGTISITSLPALSPLVLDVDHGSTHWLRS